MANNDEYIKSVTAVKNRPSDSNFMKRVTNFTPDQLGDAIDYGKKDVIHKGLRRFAEGHSRTAGKLGLAGAAIKMISDPSAASAAEAAVGFVPGVRNVAEYANPSEANSSDRDMYPPHYRKNNPKDVFPKTNTSQAPDIGGTGQDQLGSGRNEKRRITQPMN